MKVLCLNAGSSSLKMALFDVSAEGERKLVTREVKEGGEGAGAGALLGRVLEGVTDRLDAIGHRLVHGGPDRTAPLRLDPAGRAALEKAVPFAPLHLPPELAVVDAAAKAFPDVPQVACFDTAFHAALPDVARRLPVAGWADALGVRRYGFHGLSYEYVVARLGKEALGSAVLAHLGSGASVAAIKDGRSVDTTMGMTPTGGVMMGTRTGDLDPGALVYLASQKRWGASEIEHFVNHECGLRGVSETTSDMRELLAARDRDPHARLAVDLFVQGVRKTIGAYAAVLGGLRSLVFTGGIGAQSSVVRGEIAAGLGFLGVTLDADRNLAHAPVVSPDGSPCTVHVLLTDEEVVIARHVRACLG